MGNLTIRGRPKDNNGDNNPGPGHYDGNQAVVKDKVISYDMGKSPSKRNFMESKERDL
jgi:hypothetical protein